MKMHFLLYGIAALTVSCNIAMSQDLNNSYTLDSVDVHNALHLLGINVFKFPITSPTKGQDYFVNYILEEYRDGRRTASVSLLDTIKARLPVYVPISKVYTASTVGDKPRYLRAYLWRDSPNSMILGYGFDDNIQQASFPLDTSRYDMAGSRAMDFPGLSVDKRTPLVVFYMAKKGEKLLECPGDAQMGEIEKKFGYLLVLYGELRKE